MQINRVKTYFFYKPRPGPNVGEVTLVGGIVGIMQLSGSGRSSSFIHVIIYSFHDQHGKLTHFLAWSSQTLDYLSPILGPAPRRYAVSIAHSGDSLRILGHSGGARCTKIQLFFFTFVINFCSATIQSIG